VRVLTERSMRTVREVEGVAQGMEQEAKRMTAEVDIAKREFEKERREGGKRGR
jgi:hypothetical protein